jgi:ubiquinone/menaquinone biosynthesis C-methylase UbiE
MSLYQLKRFAFFREIIFALWMKDSLSKWERIKGSIKKEDKILDLGCGPGSMTMLLKKKYFHVIPLDIKDLSFSSSVIPIIYDGRNIPFPDDSFDTALILTVLHHDLDPERIIQEARRVARKIIIIEDVYENYFQKHLTFLTDSLLNFEFWNHPHSNKDDKEWKYLFEKLNLNLIHEEQIKVALLFKQATYILTP